MSAKHAAWVGWLLWWLNLSLIISGGVFEVFNWSTRAARDEASILQLIGWLIVSLAFATVGSLVVARYPANLVGWLLTAFGLDIAISVTSDSYLFYALFAEPDSLPGASLAGWFLFLTSNTLFLPLFAAFFLIFPNGRVLTPHWRAVAWLLGVGTGALVLSAFEPGPFPYFPYEGDVTIENPLGIPGADGVLGTTGSIGLALVGLSMIAGLTSLLLRMRRSRGVERQQLKWFAYAGLWVVMIWIVGPAVSVLLSLGIDNAVFNSLAVAGFGSVPLAAGIAILRHNLYDIDRLINRTLVYGLLTATLLGLYVAAVIGFGTTLRALSGESSSLATAGSTLVVAALFRPLRQRMQSFVDRHFNRSRYDAAQTLEWFTARLRDEIDLTTLTAEVCGVVQETMQPAHVTLWLRSPLAGHRS